MPNPSSENSTNSSDTSNGLWQLGSFRAFVCMRFFWGISQEIITIALAWTIFQHTHNTLSIGFVGLSSFLPSILLSLMTGLAADKLDRRHIMLACSALLATCALGLCLLTLNGYVLLVYGVVVLQGIARAFAQPASKAIIRNLGPTAMLPRTIAAATMIQGTATILGPAIGGLLIPLGVGVPFIASACCAGLSFFGALMLGPQRAKGMSTALPDLAMLFGGFTFIRSQPRVLGAMCLDFIAVLFGSATALLPFYVTEVYQAGAWAMGALRTADAIGGLIMAAVLTRYPIQRRVGLKLLIAVGIYGLTTIAFGFTTHVAFGLVCMVILGASDTVSMVTRNGLIQINTPDHMQGRVAAVHSVATGASNDLGQFESGMLSSAIGGVPAVIAGGVIATLAAVSWPWLFPSVRHADRLDDRPEEKANPIPAMAK